MALFKGTPRGEPQIGARRWIKDHPVASFFVLAYAISWLAWLPDILGYRGDVGQVLMIIAQFGPAIAALFLEISGAGAYNPLPEASVSLR